MALKSGSHGSVGAHSCILLRFGGGVASGCSAAASSSPSCSGGRGARARGGVAGCRIVQRRVHAHSYVSQRLPFAVHRCDPDTP